MTASLTYITWLNYLGGFEYFPFIAKQEHQVDILNSGQTRQNIFPQWPNSYGEYADTIDKQSFTVGKDAIILRSQLLTFNQVNILKYIKTSPVVQIVNSRTDRITVLPDKDSFKIYSEEDKTYSITFRVLMTNEIPAQRL